jgi:hypothetical protein
MNLQKNFKNSRHKIQEFLEIANSLRKQYNKTMFSHVVLSMPNLVSVARIVPFVPSLFIIKQRHRLILYLINIKLLNRQLDLKTLAPVVFQS